MGVLAKQLLSALSEGGLGLVPSGGAVSRSATLDSLADNTGLSQELCCHPGPRYQLSVDVGLAAATGGGALLQKRPLEALATAEFKSPLGASQELLGDVPSLLGNHAAAALGDLVRGGVQPGRRPWCAQPAGFLGAEGHCLEVLFGQLFLESVIGIVAAVVLAAPAQKTGADQDLLARHVRGIGFVHVRPVWAGR